jgi:hypothetical protein
MVAAASAVADGLKENPTASGINEFIVLYLIFVNGWFLYTHHITTRFEDSSFLHAMILFIFILGNAIYIVNASFETAQALAVGALLQRVSIMMIILSICLCIPRARAMGILFAQVTTVTMVFYFLTVVFPERAGIFLWIAVLIELFSEFIMAFSLRRADMIPINIEHTKDRMGILLLVMLGETVISATIEYRRLTEEEEIENLSDYYWILFWALVLVFFYTLLFFAMTPPPAFHAFRRSRLHGCTLIVVQKILCGCVLAVGAGVKLTIEAVTKQEELTDFCIDLMSLSVGYSLLLLFCLRALHYLGIIPTGSEPAFALRLMYIWWLVFAFSSLLPFLGIVLRVRDPVTSIAMYATLLFGVCFVESTFTHILEPYLIQDAKEEETALKNDTAPTSYHSTM